MQGEGNGNNGSSQQYRPSTSVLEHLRQVDFVAIIGPTAAGKSTLITAVTARNSQVHEVMNNTSRAPRAGEQDGVDCMFKSRSDMMAAMQAQQYVQVMMHPSGDIYATESQAYSAEGIAILPVLSGVVPAFRALPFKRFRIIYVLPPSWDVWMSRIATHGFTPDQQAKRLDEARESLTFAVNDPQVRFVVNDDLELSIEQFMALVTSDATDPTIQANARVLAHDLLMQLVK